LPLRVGREDLDDGLYVRGGIRPTLERDRGVSVRPSKHELVEAAVADDEIPQTATIDLAALARQVSSAGLTSSPSKRSESLAEALETLAR
jgi:hypothetical protein